MIALKLGSISVVALSGVLVGTYQLISQKNLDVSNKKFINSDKVLSLTATNKVTTLGKNHQQQRDSQFEATHLSQSGLPKGEPNLKINEYSERDQEKNHEGENKSKVQLLEASSKLDKSETEKVSEVKEQESKFVFSKDSLSNESNSGRRTRNIENSVSSSQLNKKTYLLKDEISTHHSEEQIPMKMPSESLIPESQKIISKEDDQSPESDTAPLSQTSNLEISTQEIAPPKQRQLTKEEIKAQAESVFAKLDDYTFKLFANCNTGTGWILDYQIPDKKDKYPLVWYIATNAHVVKQWYFDPSNPYSQVLPEKLSQYRQRWQDYYTYYSSKYYSLSSSENCYYKRHYGAFDMNLSKQSSGQNMNSDTGAIYQKKIKRPKLFWAALNIFDEDKSSEIKRDNFKDFAVLEIEFTSEKVAREMTRDFAIKYGGENSKNSINLFGNPISKEITKDNNENFYSLGYPKKENDKFSYAKTWNPITLEGEKLSKDPRKRETITHDKKLIGHVSAQSFQESELDWGGKKYSRSGHFYLLKGFPLGKEASGSMTVDGEGNLIGLKSRGEVGENARYSMILPIRSEGLEVEGDFKTPKYDLILGAEGQKSSYKDQVEKYGKKTWLSSMGWKHNSESPKIN